MSDVLALYPLTPAQQGMLFHALEDAGGDVYVQQLLCTLRGEVDVAALAAAWQDVGARHAALRTELLWEDVDKPLQVVRASVEIPVTVHAAGATLDDVAAAERRAGFDLAKAPLCRVAIVQFPGGAHLVWTHHHLVLDGWSLPIVTRDLFAAYGARLRGEAPSLPEPPPYKPYAAWLRARAGKVATASPGEDAFTRLLAGAQSGAPLPCESRAPRSADATGPRAPHASASRDLGAAEGAALAAFARKAGVTMAALVASAWALVLRRHAGTGESDVLFGVTLSGRPAEVPRAADLVGMFVNTLPLRVRFDDSTTTGDVLAQVQRGLVVLQENAHRSLAEAARTAGAPPGQPLFESLLVVENYPEDAARGVAASLRIEDVRTVERINYPLALVCVPGRPEHPGLALRMLHDPARFTAEAAGALLDRLVVVLEAVAGGHAGRADAVPLVRPEQRAALAAARRRATTFPVTTTLHAEIFAEARAHPEAVAVTCEDHALTYGELAARAGAFAAALRDEGVSAGDRVALCLERGADLVAAVLGILATGAAYVPLDPVHPADRLRWTAQDSGATAMLTSRAEDPFGGSASLPTVLVEDVPARAPEVDARGHAGDAAYVLYTSGSTGRPKGVVVTHANVLRLFTATRGWFGFGPGDVFSCVHSIAFDFSVWEIFGALLHGGRVVVVPRSVARAPDELRALLARERVTVLSQTPSAFAQLDAADARDDSPLALRTVVFGGEALAVDRLGGWFSRHGDARPALVNMYGITETTVHVTYRPVTAKDLGVRARGGASPVGCPIPDLTVEVIDSSGEPAPSFVPGEIYVGGAGVARGYHAREELDRVRFVTGPTGERLYRSGDVGRFVGEAELEFLGRADDQIKVRGHRVEPGEIEARLREVADVQASAVVLRKDEGREPRLVGYVVVPGSVESGALAKRLRDHLATLLPEPMIPSAFVVLPELPLTANGKVDRARLPAPLEDDGAAAPAAAPPRAARDPLEEIVTRAWARVLGAPRLGPDDDVFAHGAHSLLVTQVASRLRSTTGRDVPLRALFEHPTPARLAAHLRALGRGPGRALPPVTPVTREGEVVPLSFAQRRIWFLERLERASSSGANARSLYNVPFAARLAGPLDVGALRGALAAVVERHGALRTAFSERDGEPVQRVVPATAPELAEVDLRGVASASRDARLAAALEAEVARPFDLGAPPLLRATLVALEVDVHVLLLCVHHIAADAWSLALLLRDLVAAYEGRLGELPRLRASYTDFAVWQRSALSPEALEHEVAYFRAHLAGAPPLLDLPNDHPRPRRPTYRAGEIAFELPASEATALEARAREAGATTSIFLLAVLHALLARWSGQGDVSVGVSVAQRTRAEVEDLVGFFVNVLVVRAQVDLAASFRELLSAVRSASLGAYAHQEVPFEQVVDAVKPPRSLSHAPLFQVNFVYQNVPVERLWGAALAGPAGTGARLALSPVRLGAPTSRFDLVLTLEEPSGGPLRGTLSYARDLFEHATAEAFVAQYLSLAKAAALSDDEPVARLGASSPVASVARVPSAAPPLLHVAAFARAKETPEAPAITMGARVVTYGALGQHVHALARELRQAGVSGGARVGVAMGRSPERIVALLAVLAAGGAFVPLEPSLPLARRAELLARSGAAVVLVDETGEDELPPFAGLVVRVEADAPAAGDLAPPFEVPREGAAYVLFTSGSTGEPKGVVVTHRGLANLAEAQGSAFGITPEDRVLSFASFAFDAFVSEVAMALGRGAVLDLGEEALAPRDAVLATLADRRVTVVTLPPSLLASVDPGARGGLPDLRVLVSAGEPLLEPTARAWSAAWRATWNAYGPTECTVCATMYRWPGAVTASAGSLAEDAPARVPIGSALAGARVAVHDEEGKAVPLGVVGELVVGGEGVAEGYLGDPARTAEAFVLRDLGAGPERVYRTGDRVRALANGALEFLGRRDDQVKVRGVRVELGEVEWALAQHPAVALAAARVASGRLLAWVTLRDGATAEPRDILARAKERVAAALVPSSLVVVPSMPRTASGKIDRAALPLHADHADEAIEPGRAPRPGLEADIARLWSELLGRARVLRDDDFFALGGHSLVSLQIAARLHASRGVDVPVSVVFEHPVLEAFAAAVARLTPSVEASATGIPRLAREGDLPLSFAEERLWVLEQLQPGTSAYGVAVAFRVEGPLDEARFARAVAAVLERHEILRTTYEAAEGRPVARIGPVHPEAFERVALAGEDAIGGFVDAAARVSFALDRAPLARFLLGHVRADLHVLVVAMHHALADAWSMDLLLRDLGRAYAGDALPAASLGYRDFAAWQRALFASGQRDHLLARARARLEGAALVLDLPEDRSPPREPAARAIRRRAMLPAETAAALASVGEAHRASLFIVTLTAFLVVLERWTGRKDLLVGTPSAHRPRAALEDVVGNFLGSLVVRADLGGAATVSEVLARVRAASLAALEDEDLPFELLTSALAPPRDLGRNPIFQVLFTLTTQPSGQGASPLEGLVVTPLVAEGGFAKVDLSLGVAPHPEGLEAVLELRADRFDPGTAELLLEGFAEVARALAAARPEDGIGVLHAATERAWSPRLGARNATRAPEVGTSPVVARIRAAAARAPEAIAVRLGDDALTYAALLREGERFAGALGREGVSRGDRVAIAMARSPRLVAVLLGVLLAGAAYVPIPADTPAARAEHMRTSARVRFTATDAWAAAIDGAPAASDPALGDLAYVLFTSGSTGHPKGVEIEHGALANVVDAFVALLDLRPEDRWLAVTPLSFDIAGLELWCPLVVGGAIELATEEEAGDGAALAARLARAAPTVLQATPSTYRMLLASGATLPLASTRLLSGGEPLTATVASELLRRAAALWNVYGPTETTIWSTALRVTEDEVARGGWLALGAPLANTTVRVVDAEGAPRTFGAGGELVIAGSGVARGYVGAPERAHEAFVTSPEGRAYRTGDRVRVRWDGALVFEGRGDGQVKLRGHRIELGEIEAALEAHPDVAEAAAALESHEGEAWLVAHVVPKGGAADEAALRSFLGEKLPLPMVPTWVAFAPALPRTPNGKLDRRALPALAPARRASGEPTTQEDWTAAEREVAAIVAEVLHLARVERGADFFALGGHSLLATELVARLRARLGVDLPLRAVFEAKTVSGIAARASAEPSRARRRIPRRTPSAREVPSFAQERLWILSRLEPGVATYHLPVALRLRGALDAGLLAEALSVVVRRHAPLRTRFVADEAGLGAVVDEAAKVSLASEPCAEEALPSRLRALAGVPFDLARESPLRAHLLALAADDHVLFLVVHHVAADAASMEIATREVAEAYRALASGEAPRLPELAVGYLDFARWQRAEGRAAFASALARARVALADLAPCEVAADRPRVGSEGAAPTAGLVTRALAASEAQRLAAFVAAEGTTLFAAALAALAVVLGRHGGTEDVRVGTPFGGRADVDLEPLVGPLLETTVLRVSLAGDPSVGELVLRAREAVATATERASVPFDELVRAVDPDRDTTRTPLFQAMLLVHRAGRVAIPPLAGLVAEPVAVPPVASPFELTFALTEQGGGVDLALEYRADLFEEATATRLVDALAFALSTLPGERGPARMLSASESCLLTGPAGAPFEPVHALVARHLARREALTAVTAPHTGARVTGAELEALAGGVAAALASLGASPGDVVALDLRRSQRLVAAMLGALRAGVAYLPLDPAWPAERKDALRAQAGAVGTIDDETIAVRGATCAWSALPGPRAASSQADPEATAYVLFTSGSTGTPKGVVVTHGNVANLVTAMARRFALTEKDRVLQFASASFDASVEEIFPTLASGATLVLRSDEPPGSVQAFLDDVEREEITVLDLPTALWHAWVDECPDRLPASVRLVIVGGEAATHDRLVRFRQGPARAITWMNTYGPTEATVTALAYELPPGAETPDHVPVGRPIDGVVAAVVDAAGERLPEGCPGELWLSGLGVARGYVGADELTGARFVERYGARFYRTGDRVRLRASGELEFLGRLDEQLKVRGHRIEPGEVEAALRRHPSVRDAAVVARGDALVAFVVPRGADLDPEALRAALASTLPAALVPSAFVPIAELPTTTAGKVDRRKLPAGPARTSGRGRTPPRTALEQFVASAFEELLSASGVTLEDDFFALGGHSLLATRLLSRLRSRFGVELPLRVVFEASTVSALAARVAAFGAAGTGAIPRRPAGSTTVASFAQERLYFLDRLEPGTSAYNLPAAMTLEGDLDADALVRALQLVWTRHEGLRGVFEDDHGAARPRALPAEALVVGRVDHGALPVAERDAAALEAATRDALAPFDLARGPLLRAALHRISDARHVLVVTMHHVVSDGWSTGVFLREAITAYRAFVAGSAPDLPVLPIQYGDFAAWQRARFEAGALDAGLRHFRAALAGAPALLELPTDRPRPRVQGYEGDDVRWAIPREHAEALRAFAAARGATPFMVLLAALHATLGRLAGTHDVLVGASVANRHRAELEPLVGFFVNIVVLRADLAAARTFDDLVAQVRERTLGALEHEDVPFDRVVEALAPERSLGHAPLFQVNFVLQNAPTADASVPGLAMRPLAVSAKTARFDLVFALEETQDGAIDGTVTYRTDVWDRKTAERFASAYRTLLASAVAAPGRALGRLPLLGDAARAEVLARGLGPRTRERSRPLTRVVEEIAAREGSRIALAHADRAVDYATLASRVSRLARHLRAFGVDRGVRVAVAAGRVPERWVGVLSVLAAGGAFVPIDDRVPPARVAQMLEDARVAMVLATEERADHLPTQAAHVMILEEAEDQAAHLASDPLPTAPEPEDEAYVMFTSGSTGRPKGVRVAHRGLLNLAVAQREAFGVRPEDRVLQFAAFGFDASVSEMAMALTCGATLDLGDGEDAAGGASVEELLVRRGITVVTLPPSLLARTDRARVPALRVVISAGEPLPPAVARAWSTGALFNAYGPTEATVCATIHRVEARDGEGVRVPVGRPIDNVTVHVVDEALEPVPPGVVGELVLGGVGLALGYLGGDDARFPTTPLGRVYRTGDRGRDRGDGVLELVGRDDAQVKIRGHRVELGDVEHALASHPAVAHAVAMVRDDVGEAEVLVAYVVPKEGRDAPDARELRAHMEGRVPGYMVPAHVVVLEAFPASAAGKVDRRALPRPFDAKSPAPAGAQGFLAARTDEERAVAETWAAVLGRPRVGARDNFFEIGGDSISSLQAVARLAERGLAVTAKQIFEHQTVERVAAAATRRAATEAARAPDVAGAEHPPTPLQEGLLFHALYADEAPVYVSQLTCRVVGALDVGVLRAAWRAVTARHDALRTSFAWGPRGPVARVAAEVDVPLVTRDEPAWTRDEVDAFAREERARGFDVEKGPLFRLALVRISPTEHALVFTHHHLVLDGWSVAIVLAEVVSFVRGVRPETLSPALSFGAYAAHLAKQDLARSEAFFARLLEGARPTPLGLGRELGARHAVVHVRERALCLPEAVTARVEEGARALGVTVATVVTAAWAELLGRYARTRDVVIGVTMSDRPAELPGSSAAVGLFLSTLPARVRRDPGLGRGAWLGRVQADLVELREHAHMPLARVKARSGVAAEASLFESIVVFENFPVSAPEGATSAMRLEDVRGAEQTSYPLTIVAAPGPELELRVAYDADRFEEAEVADLLARLGRLVAALAEERATPIARASIVDAAEAEASASALRGPAVTARDPLLVEAFLAAVARAPDAIAVHDVATGARTTYAALAARAEAFARPVRAHAAAEPVVAVALPRGVDLVAALLGVAAAGGVFLPLDPAHPEARLRHQLTDARAALVIASRATANVAGEAAVLLAEDLVADAALTAAASSPSAPAYVLYTSGSTGKPKGVLVEHGPLARYLAFARGAYRLGAGDAAVVHTSVAFDLTLTTLLAPLTAGGVVVLAPEGDGIAPLASAIEAASGRLALLKMTPSHARLLAAELSAQRPLARAIVLGGEALPMATVRALQALDPEATIDNEYGPTEAVVGCVLQRFSPGADVPAGEAFAPIGRPIDGVVLAVVDDLLAPVPRGVVGELLVGGAALARGYLGRPEETAARFVEVAGLGRMYRTGDLVRLGVDGTLAYLGREDDQVKIRGHRVELGEVEAALLAAPGVREACAVADRRGDDARLVAFVVAEEAGEETRARVLAAMRLALPPAFVPTKLVFVDALPLAPSGKVDRAALAAREVDAEEAPRDVRPPEGPREAALAEIWRDVLGARTLDREDDFFALGGDSILALQVIARAAARGLRLTPRVIFGAPTLAAMAAAATEVRDPAARADDAPGEVPLLPIQRWFFASGRQKLAHYNQSLLLASRAPMPAAQLEALVRAVFDHHGLTRTRFTRAEDGWRMERTVEARHEGLVTRIELASFDDAALARAVEEHAARAQASLDLEAGPLARVVWFDAGPSRPARLLVAIHHLVVDAVSFRILLSDLEGAFRALTEGRSPTPPAVPATFPEFARALAAYAAEPRLREELGYWEAVLEGPRTTTAREDATWPRAGAARPSVRASHRATTKLDAPERDMHSRLLAALASALAEAAGHDVLVDVEGHGREEIPGHALDLSRAVGWFTSLYPVRLAWPREGSPEANARALAAELRAVPNRGLGFGVLRWMSPDEGVRARLSRARAEVSFNYLGRLDGALEEGGPFAPASEDRGPEEAAGEPRAHLLEVNAFAARGELVVEWTYPPELVTEESLTRIAARFFETLRALGGVDLAPARGEAGDDELAVCLRRHEGEAPPLFLVHPVGGLVGCYAELARAMRGRAVYGLQAEGVDGRAPMLGSLQAMAERYAAAIRSVVSDGPYVLGGWSMGAIVAHAMTCLPEERRGQRVGPLVALDQTPAEVRRELDDAALLVEIVGDAIPLEAASLRTMSVREQVRFVLEEAKRRGLPLAGLDEEDVRRHIELCKTNFRALSAHAPGASRADVLLLRAARRPSWEPADVDAASEWRRFTTGTVAVHDVDADHVTLVKAPAVARVALLIESALALP